MTATLFDFPCAPLARRRARARKEADQPYTEEFEAFWKLYPRKLNCSKFEASKSWNKLSDAIQAQAMAALPVFCLSVAHKDEQYICHPATWINQRRFETVAVRTPVPGPTVATDWPTLIRVYKATGRWNPCHGPAPDEFGFRGPK